MGIRNEVFGKGGMCFDKLESVEWVIEIVFMMSLGVRESVRINGGWLWRSGSGLVWIWLGCLCMG